MERQLAFIVSKTQHCQDLATQNDLQIYAIPIKIPIAFFQNWKSGFSNL